MRRAIIGIFTAIVLLILFMVLCTFIKRPYEVVLLDRFGRIIPENEQAHLMYNWYFKMPTDSVVRIDKRLHLYTGSLQQIATRNKEPISIRTFAAWHIVDPTKFYYTTGGSDEKAREIMELKLQGLVQGKLAAHDMDELFNTDETKIHTGTIEDEVAKEATFGSAAGGVATGGLQDQGLEIVEVGFSRMAFPPSNADAIYGRMVSDLAKRASLYDAQGRAAAATLEAQGNRDAQQIIAQATAEAQQIRGKGDQEALAILSEVQQTPASREFYQYWKSLEFAKNTLQKNTVLVLSADNDLVKSIFNTPPTGMNIPTTRPMNAALPHAPQPPLDLGVTGNR
jgi:membrane protease subunit HflC